MLDLVRCFKTTSKFIAGAVPAPINHRAALVDAIEAAHVAKLSSAEADSVCNYTVVSKL